MHILYSAHHFNKFIFKFQYTSEIHSLQFLRSISVVVFCFFGICKCVLMKFGCYPFTMTSAMGGFEVSVYCMCVNVKFLGLAKVNLIC